MRDRRKDLLKADADPSFLGNVRYPERTLRRRYKQDPPGSWSWNDRPTVTVPFTARSYQGLELSAIDDVNNGFFWNHVKVVDGKLVPKYKRGHLEYNGGVSQTFIDGVLRYGNVGSGLLIQVHNIRPILIGGWTPLHIANKLTFNGQVTYTGGVCITGAVSTSEVPTLKPHVLTPKKDLELLGTFAIGETAPTKSASNLGQALAELKDGLPSIPGRDFSKNPSFGTAGSEYLNVQFGIVPTVQDSIEVFHAIRRSRQILEQYVKDSGKLVRRKYQFRTTRETKVYTDVRLKTGSTVTNCSQIVGNVTDETVTEIWFRGAFRYELPDGTSALAKLKRFESKANKLLGLRLTPELLWQLTPWSWMVDWFVDVGSVMHNISLLMNDGLVVQHGYLMEHKVTTRTYESNEPLKVSKCISQEIYETKRRIPATPFGFGIDFDALTQYQWSILIALGLSKGKSKPPQI